jgi:hypothetical protein
MKIGDLVRIKKEYAYALKLKPGMAYLIITPCPLRSNDYWTLMDNDGIVIKVSTESEYVFDVVSEARNCLNDGIGRLNR